MKWIESNGNGVKMRVAKNPIPDCLMEKYTENFPNGIRMRMPIVYRHRFDSSFRGGGAPVDAFSHKQTWWRLHISSPLSFISLSIPNRVVVVSPSICCWHRHFSLCFLHSSVRPLRRDAIIICVRRMVRSSFISFLAPQKFVHTLT